MSGIAALFSRSGDPAHQVLLERMVASQRFRGPDGEGAWRKGPVGLGHTLFRTTVEAERERSPSSLEDRLFVAADIRLDARDELVGRLRERRREVGVDLPDAELLLFAYDVWGESCVDHLLGDFSFALWDAPRRRLVCAVDPLGVKPFFYAHRDGLFVGANTVRTVRLHPGVRGAIDEIAAGDFLLTGVYQDPEKTIFADISRIPAGHVLVVADGAVALRRYYRWPEPESAPSGRTPDPSYVEQFEGLLTRAVRDRLRAPKAAMFMSGGVDSTLVALVAKRELGRRFPNPELRAFTAVYDHLIPDEERRYAELAAKSIGIGLDIQAFDGGSLFGGVGRVSPAEPSLDVLLEPYLDQLDRVLPFRVGLSGYDGDALLAAAVRLHWRERIAQRRFKELAGEIAWYVRHQRALPPVGIRTWLARRRPPVPLRRPAWIHPSFWRRADLDRRAESFRLPNVLRSHARAPAKLRFGGPAWVRLFDGYDPGFSGLNLEVRHPLTDLRLVHFTAALPAVPWCVDKHLLRQGLSALPAEIRTRPKAPLARDPVIARVRRGELARLIVSWRSPALSQFCDERAVEAALRAEPSADDGQTWMLIRTVALGVWAVSELAD